LGRIILAYVSNISSAVLDVKLSNNVLKLYTPCNTFKSLRYLKINNSTNVYKQFSGVAPLTVQISCHICFAKSVGLTSAFGLIWSFVSLIEEIIFSNNFGKVSSSWTNSWETKWPSSLIILFPVIVLIHNVSDVSVTIKTVALNFLATLSSWAIAFSFCFIVLNSVGRLYSITAMTFFSFTINPSIFFLSSSP